MDHIKPKWREQLLVKAKKITEPLRPYLPRRPLEIMANIIAGKKNYLINLGNGALFETDTTPYYRMFAHNIRKYEPELWTVLDSEFLSPDTLFIDGGANIGLWSCYAAAHIKNKEQVIAIEPSDSVSKQLERNLALNNGSFTIRKEALWSHSGEKLFFDILHSHQASHLTNIDSHIPSLSHRISVNTICVDDLVQLQLGKSPNIKNVILKLDIEGAEPQALQGAKNTLLDKQKNTLIIFEDHGQDDKCQNTKRAMELNLNIYYLDEITLIARRIRNIEELTKIKQIKSKGYNFFACQKKSPFDQYFQKMQREQTLS